jgi:hypothetical protein
MEYLDRVLTAEEEIVPSAGFTQAVMDSVRRETSGPMPIPFPWKRALPGLLLVVLVLVALVFVPAPINSSGQTELPTMQLAAMLTALLETIRGFYVNWLLGSLLLAWACVNLSARLASLRR